MRRCAAFAPAYAGESTAATVGHNGLVGRPATGHPSAARPLQSCTQRRSNMRLLDQHIKQRSTAWIEMELGAPGYSSKICQYRSLAWDQFFEGVALLSHGIVWSAVVSAAMKHGMGHNMGRHVRVLDTTPSALPSRDGVELRTATEAFVHQEQKKTLNLWTVDLFDAHRHLCNRCCLRLSGLPPLAIASSPLQVGGKAHFASKTIILTAKRMPEIKGWERT